MHVLCAGSFGTTEGITGVNVYAETEEISRDMMGQYVTQALSNKDYSAIQGFILVATLFSMVLYLILDLIQMAIDPRIKY